MRKIFAASAVFFLILTFTNNVSLISNGSFINESNEPDIVKNQMLIESAKITDVGMASAKEMLLRAYTENLTEADVANAAAEAMVAQGSSEYIEAFGVMVASGEQSALPHGDASDDETNLILPEEVVVVDLGARYRGYCTDLTRTFFMGEPTSEMMEIYNITLEAQEAGIQAVSAGALARDVDKVARDIISSYGYGENFTHGLGHGIGLRVHMPPTLSPNSNGVLMQSSDMAITIEPGIYLAGRFGVRIEDDVLVKRNGFEKITNFPKGIEEAIIYPPHYLNSSGASDSARDKQLINLDDPIFLGIIILFIALGIGIILIRKYSYKFH